MLELLNKISTVDLSELREKISELEGDLMELPQVDIKINHHFSKDVYAREMVMPAGTMVIGKIHKFENLCIISKGEVSVLSQDGLMKVKAPYTFVATPGAKRVIYAHDEVVWTVIHGTDETDLEKIEDQFIAKSYDEVKELDAKVINLIQQESKECLG